MVAEEWGACGAGLACTRSEDVLLRYRGVWCADAVSWPEDSGVSCRRLAGGVL